LQRLHLGAVSYRQALLPRYCWKQASTSRLYQAQVKSTDSLIYVPKDHSPFIRPVKRLLSSESSLQYFFVKSIRGLRLAAKVAAHLFCLFNIQRIFNKIYFPSPASALNGRHNSSRDRELHISIVATRSRTPEQLLSIRAAVDGNQNRIK
jgi:hypothetical protein